MANLTHLNAQGKINMVDVSAKEPTTRKAKAIGCIYVSGEAIKLIKENNLKKGDALATSKIAGILGAKHTSSIIPLCHNIPISSVNIDVEIDESKNKIIAVAQAITAGQTGIEMEALMAVSCTLLGLYDMIKAVDKTAHIEGIKLLEKSGGKSGLFKREDSHED